MPVLVEPGYFCGGAFCIFCNTARSFNACSLRILVSITIPCVRHCSQPNPFKNACSSEGQRWCNAYQGPVKSRSKLPIVIFPAFGPLSVCFVAAQNEVGKATPMLLWCPDKLPPVQVNRTGGRDIRGTASMAGAINPASFVQSTSFGLKRLGSSMGSPRLINSIASFLNAPSRSCISSHSGWSYTHACG